MASPARRCKLRVGALTIVLHETEIDSLVNKGFLRPERRQDQAAIQSAIDGFICHALAPGGGGAKLRPQWLGSGRSSTRSNWTVATESPSTPSPVLCTYIQ